MRRINIIGVSGSGKTTIGSELAARLGLTYLELDALCHGPNWAEASDESFREQIQAVIKDDGWVIDGMYERKIGDLVFLAADTVVWLDFPLPLILWRLWRRTSRRILHKVELWNGNRETWRDAFWGPKSLFGYALHHHGALRRKLPGRLSQPALSHVRLVHLRSPTDLRRWILEEVESTPARLKEQPAR